MASPQAIHGHNSPLQDLQVLRQKLEKRGVFKEYSSEFQSLQTAVQKLWDEDLNTYRLFRDEAAPAPSGGGGGKSTETPAPPPPIVYPFCKITYGGLGGWPLGMNLDTGTWFPVQQVNFRLWDDTLQRYKVPVFNQCEIQGIQGHIWIQTETDPPEQHYVDLRVEEGSPVLTPGRLLGFDIGFERMEDYGRKRGKFFVDVLQFPVELSNPRPTQIINEIHDKASKKLRTTDPILTSSQVDEYSYENGGQGLKFYCDLTMFVK